MERLVRQAIKFFKDWQERRFLKKHRCESWKEYHRRYDPDVEFTNGLSPLKDIYKGYQHFCKMDVSLQDYGLGGLGPNTETISALEAWCEDNCKGKWRLDIIGFVSKSKEDEWMRHGKDDDGFWSTVTFENIPILQDQVFVAFQDSRDYVLFSLRWQ